MRYKESIAFGVITRNNCISNVSNVSNVSNGKIIQDGDGDIGVIGIHCFQISLFVEKVTHGKRHCWELELQNFYFFAG